MVSSSKGKGIARSALKRLKFEAYKRTLFGGESLRTDIPTIRTFDFTPYKITTNKLALQVFEGNSSKLFSHSTPYFPSSLFFLQTNFTSRAASTVTHTKTLPWPTSGREKSAPGARSWQRRLKSELSTTHGEKQKKTMLTTRATAATNERERNKRI